MSVREFVDDGSWVDLLKDKPSMSIRQFPGCWRCSGKE